MRIALTVWLALGLLTTGCERPVDQLPPVAAPGSGEIADPGFAIKPRSGCSDAVLAALRQPDLNAIAQAAAQGEDFTCGGISKPLPLDEAVLSRATDRVRMLLESGADPNARWSSHGDRNPLQEAIECKLSGTPCLDRAEIVRLLLRHGADPNGRWCPFESRAPDPAGRGCISKAGVTPLIVAAAFDQADTTYLLLDARADPTLEDWAGASALDDARGEAVFELLLPAQFATSPSREAAALAYLSNREPRHVRAGPWNQTPLSRAIFELPPPPPLPPPAPTSRANPVKPASPSPRAGRVKALLRIGADPNQRLSGVVDWTPLALAVTVRDVEVAEVLLKKGSDPNARWCSPVTWDREALDAATGCQRQRGLTPLMWAAYLGAEDLIRVLLRYGADPSLRDWQNKTALDHALPESRQGIALALSGR